MTHCDPDEVDKRTTALRDELDKHVKEMRIEIPVADWGDIYEGWAIQKIAGLQVLVLQLVKEIQDVRAQLEKEIQELRAQLESVNS